MKKVNDKTIIIILGTGRSGTSLLMQILAASGIHHADNLIGADESNLAGHLEDADIVRMQEEFLAKLQKKQGINYPIVTEQSLQSKGAKKLKKQIVEHVLKELSGDNFYAIKDPRTVTLLPIWQEIFQENNIKPIYLFAARNPMSVIKSLRTYYNTTTEEAEMMWLQRTISSFYHTKSQLFIVHYENWFDNPIIQLNKLLEYLHYDSSANINDVIKLTINKDLYKITIEDDKINNKKIEEIYNFFSGLHGSDFVIGKTIIFFEKQWNDMMSYTKNVKSLLEAKTQQIKQKDQQIQKKIQQLTKIQNSKSCLLGSLFFRSLKKPYKLITYPINFIRILFNN